MNIYTQRFRASCPKNGCTVDYCLRIETAQMIMVEEIQAVVKTLQGYHEEFADILLAKFGGVQTLKAHHHGTDIETIRP